MNTSTKTRLVSCILIAALLLSGSLAGFTTLAADGEKETTKIKFYHDNPELNEFWKEISNLSTEEIGIGLDLVTFNSTDNEKMRVRTDIRTSKAPGLHKWWFGEQGKPLIESGLEQNLDGVWDEVESNFNPGIRELASWDGTAYALPFNYSPWVWFYNKEVFNKYGKEPADTFEEFMNNMKFFEEKGLNPIGHTYGSPPSWMSIIMPMELIARTNYNYWKKLRKGEGSWTGDPVVKAFEIWNEMLTKDFFPPADWTSSRVAKEFANGNIAYIPMGTWFISYLRDIDFASPDNIGLTMMPSITPEGEKVMFAEMTVLMAPKKSPNAEAARKWLKWWGSSKQAAKKFTEKRGISPYRGGLFTEKELKELSPLAPRLNELSEQYSNKAVRFWEAFPTEFVSYSVSQFQQMMDNPDQYMENLENLEKKANEIW